jgi:ribosomal protein S18 acetylase RimI-like enzyme
MPSLQSRPIVASDETFLRAVYAATREEEIARTNWDADTVERFLRMQFDAQHAHYMMHYKGASFDVVLADDVPAGRLYVHSDADAIHIIDIALLPAFRARGIGSSLLGGLMEMAAREGKRLTIHVELDNRAFSLYQRLGFKEVSVSGFHRLMQWLPATPATAP